MSITKHFVVQNMNYTQRYIRNWFNTRVFNKKTSNKYKCINEHMEPVTDSHLPLCFIDTNKKLRWVELWGLTRVKADLKAQGALTEVLTHDPQKSPSKSRIIRNSHWYAIHTGYRFAVRNMWRIRYVWGV